PGRAGRVTATFPHPVGGSADDGRPPLARLSSERPRTGSREERRKEASSSSNDLQLHVYEELLWDPKVDSKAIAVSADDDGVVTLRGTVGSFRQKREAKQDAERLYGVKNVENQLEVRILNDDRRADADLRGDVLQALMLNSLVPATIDAKVDDGIVTLTG